MEFFLIVPIISQIMNDYFVKVTIPSTETFACNVMFMNPIDQIIFRYKNHPSILNTLERVEHQENFVKFKFQAVSTLL